VRAEGPLVVQALARDAFLAALHGSARVVADEVVEHHLAEDSTRQAAAD
jgi:hypothetical protein